MIPTTIRREVTIGSRTLSIETGKLAKQADGAVLVRSGDTVVLVTACRSANAREGIDFLPLTVDYREYTYASGRIPGGFFKREGKPAEKEVLTSRVIDRPIRPLFPAGWRYETQIIALVLSADTENLALGDTLGEEDAALAGVENHETLQPLVKQLPERERTILALRFVHNMTQTQIAERIGISQMHVSRLLARTLKKLREGLVEEDNIG